MSRLAEFVGKSGWLVLAGVSAVSFLAPATDSYLFPVRNNQKISGVTRYADRLCFKWESEKLQSRVSDDIDTALYVGDDKFDVSLYEEDTQFPWGRSRAVGVGWHVQPFCVNLPPNVKETDELRLESVILYPGSFGRFWHVKLKMPDVVSRGRYTGGTVGSTDKSKIE